MADDDKIVNIRTLASPAMGHWGMLLPPRLPAINFSALIYAYKADAISYRSSIHSTSLQQLLCHRVKFYSILLKMFILCCWGNTYKIINEQIAKEKRSTTHGKHW